jgi:hypothetical protein
MRSARQAALIAIVLGTLALAAFTAAAADLQAFSGTWAYTAANCSAYLHDRIANEARKRGAGLIIIRPAEIEWVTPASCEVANLRAAGERWDMDGKCEIKGRDFTADITLTAGGTGHISLGTKAAEFGSETHGYVRCSTATEWRAN